MLKNCATIFSFLFLIFFTQIAVAQESGEEVASGEARDEAVITTGNVNLPYQTVYFEDADILYDNGPLITLPGGGCSGGDASILDGTLGHTLYGWNVNQAAGGGAYYYMADDFTSGSAWNIDSIKFFAYQTGAATSTLTGVYVQILNGAPNAGGSVVWGNTTTNVMQRTGLTNIYRALDTAPTNCDRRVQEIVAAIGTNLPPGTYWVQWGITGSAASGPWQPPVTVTGQAVTGDALQLTSTGWTPALNGTSPNGAPFIVYGTSGPPIGPGPATNPNPASGASNVNINADLSWDNPAGATSVEVFFGTDAGNLTSVYSGSPVATWDPGAMEYSTQYYWRVNETDGTGTSVGSLWNFTTMVDPNAPVFVIPSDYTNVPGTATFLGPLYTGARTYQLLIHEDLLTSLIDKEIQALSWRIPTSATEAWPPSDVTVTDYNIYLSGSVPPANRDLTNFAANVVGNQIQVRSGSLFIPANSYTFGNIPNNWGPEITFNTGYLYTGGHLLIEIRLSGTGNSRNTDALGTSTAGYGSLFSACWGNGMTANSGSQGNFTIVRVSAAVIPVELTSFTASVIRGKVNLNWQTASETNNYGFEVERKAAGQDFGKVAFVAGYGTTTEAKSYSFVDNTVSTGSFTYRLKQVDFDGTFEYSNEVEVDLAPSTYSLAQNYPNPFNPVTKIDFSLASESKVTLKIFDVLGQEVRTLINGNLAAQSHSIEFDATSLNSGIYFYTIEAKGADGTNFTSTKKMILTK